MKRFEGVVCALAATFAVLCASASEVSTEKATRAVQSWMRRSLRPMSASFRSAKTVGTRSFTNETGRALFHVIDVEGGGFVITSGDTKISPIVAFADSGDCVLSEANPLYGILVGDMNNRLSALDAPTSNAKLHLASVTVRSPFRSGETPEAEWASLTEDDGAAGGNVTDEPLPPSTSQTNLDDVRVKPIVASKWNQSAKWNGYNVYNYYTPGNYNCGCTATAVAQIMRYWEKPDGWVERKTLTCTFNGVSTNITMMGGSYAWNNMPLTYDGISNKDQCMAIGKLCFDVAVASKMSWKKDSQGGTSGGAGLADAAEGLRSCFGYSSATSENLGASTGNLEFMDYASRLLGSLNAGMPTVIGIYKYGENGHADQSGHSVILDGYGYYGTTMYGHINWGWGGGGVWYDLFNETTSGYNYIWVCIYNIHPSETGSVISGRVTDSRGIAFDGATVRVRHVSSGTDEVTKADERGIWAIRTTRSGAFTVQATTSIAGGAESGVSQKSLTSGNLWDVDLVIPTIFQKCAVSLDRQGGIGGTGNVTATYGEELPTIKVPTLIGSVFDGYFSGINGSGTKYYNADGTSVRAWDRLNATTLYAKWKALVPGTLAMTVEEAVAGEMLKVTVSRVGGAEGRIAVKLKTQDSATVSGINGVSGRDFQYVKEYLVWEDGDVSDRVVYVPTYITDADGAVTFRLKLSVQTTGDYADCVTPTLAGGGKVIASVTPAAKGTLAFTAPDPMSVLAGEPLRVKVSRVGGSAGRVAVKLKTQDSATVDGVDGVSGLDFQYVKEYLVWDDGDDSDREVEIPTYAAWWNGEPRTFRLKLSVQTTGDYAGCVTPALADGGKVIASIEPNDEAYPGEVKVTKVETLSCCSVRADEPLTASPWWGYAGDTLRVTVSRVGGSFGRVVVKAKTQGYPGVSNLSAVLNEDLTYVKEYIEWKDGEAGDKVIDIPTALVDGTDYPLTFRLKFTAQTTGDYEDCVEPELPETKNVIELREE